MNKRKWVVSVGAFLLVLLLASGYLALAAEYGSQEDPLVTLSYITDVLSPATMDAVDKAIDDKVKSFEADMDAKIASYTQQIDSKISAATINTNDEEFINAVADAVIEKMGGVSAAAPASEWKVVKIASGKTVICKVGVEVLLRIGSATCVASGTTGLINLSSATNLANGGALATNNLYIVTIDGRGFKATSDATVLIRGEYTIS